MVQVSHLYVTTGKTIALPLVWEDSRGCGATKPEHHRYRRLQVLEVVLCNRRSHRSEKPAHSNRDQTQLK